MVKAVIFDFFDVVHRDPLKAWLSDFGLEKGAAVIEACRLLDLGKIDIEEYTRRLADFSGQTEAAINAHAESSAKLDDGIVELLNAIQGVYQTALISNAHSKEIRPLLKRHTLEPLFNEIVISSEVGHAKPSPEIFHFTLERLGVRPAEAVFIDDSMPNVDAAEALGIKAFCYTNIASLRRELETHGLTVRLTAGVS